MLFRLDPSAGGIVNMATDLALVESTTGGELAGRTYDWDEVWITIGRNQNPYETLIDFSATKWARRPTGGQAVLHGHDLTVALVMPIQKSEALQLRRLYRAITAPLIAALRAGGVPTILGEDAGLKTGGKMPDCFATVAKNDIVHEETGAKVCGCALRVYEDAVLIQASIPVREPVRPVGEIIRDAQPTPHHELDRKAFEEKLKRALSELESARQIVV